MSFTDCYRSDQDIVNQAVLECSDRQMYGIDRELGPKPNGLLDRRMVGLYGLDPKLA